MEDPSFAIYEGTGTRVSIPRGTRIPLQLTRVGKREWSVTVQPESLDLPPVTMPRGIAVQWKLSGPAVGTLEATRDGVVWKLDAPVVSYVDGSQTRGPTRLRFTTGIALRTSGKRTAWKRGARLNPETGEVRLVTAGLIPEDAETAPGKPFSVVLSGRLEGLPEDIARGFVAE